MATVVEIIPLIPRLKCTRLQLMYERKYIMRIIPNRLVDESIIINVLVTIGGHIAYSVNTIRNM